MLRAGPEPMAKYPGGSMAQPAYWLAMHADTGWSVATSTAGSQRPPRSTLVKDTVARPARQISASRRPASSPPGARTPQSSTRAPPDLRDRDTEEGRVGRERVGESRGAAVQAEVQAHGASRHDAPRFRAGLTSTHASRSPNALRSASARSRAAGSPRTSAKTVGPQELCPTP